MSGNNQKKQTVAYKLMHIPVPASQNINAYLCSPMEIFGMFCCLLATLIWFHSAMPSLRVATWSNRLSSFLLFFWVFWMSWRRTCNSKWWFPGLPYSYTPLAFPLVTLSPLSKRRPMDAEIDAITCPASPGRTGGTIEHLVWMNQKALLLSWEAFWISHKMMLRKRPLLRNLH